MAEWEYYDIMSDTRKNRPQWTVCFGIGLFGLSDWYGNVSFSDLPSTANCFPCYPGPWSEASEWKPLKSGWLEHDPFLLGVCLFSGAFAVSFREGRSFRLSDSLWELGLRRIHFSAESPKEQVVPCWMILTYTTVDGWNPANQLRLVVYPIIFRVSAPSQVVQDFSHQQ